MTKSPFTTHSEINQRCAAQVDYKSRQGACKREGKHPDVDGVRWWCGLHDPRKKAAKAKPVDATAEPVEARPKAVVDTTPLPGNSLVVDELVSALRISQEALAEVANTKDNGWAENTPVENYRVILKHLNDRAKAASDVAAAALRYAASVAP